MIAFFSMLPQTIAENKQLDKLISEINKLGFRVKCPNCRHACSYFNYGGYALRCSGCTKAVGKCRCRKVEQVEQPPYSTHATKSEYKPLQYSDVEMDCTDTLCSDWNANRCECKGCCSCHWKQSQQWNPF